MFSLSSCFNKIKRQFYRTVENVRNISLKRPLQDIIDDEPCIKQPYEPLRKRVRPSMDEVLPASTRTLSLKPTLRWKSPNRPFLATIQEDEAAESVCEEQNSFKIKESINVREPAISQASVSPSSSLTSQWPGSASDSSTKTIESRLSTQHKHECANNRKIFKTSRNSSMKVSKPWLRKSSGSTNYREANKKPLHISSSKWKQPTILESFRIEEKKQYQQLLQQCTLNQPHPPSSPPHGVHQISRSSNSSPVTYDVRWSRSSSSNSVQFDEEWRNTLPTSPSSRLQKPSELGDKYSRKENKPTEDHKRPLHHCKSSRMKVPMSDITKANDSSNSRIKASRSDMRNHDLSSEEESLDQLARQFYSHKKNCKSVPVIDITQTDSDSLESMEGSDSDGVEIVDEFPHGKKKINVLTDLNDRKCRADVLDEHSSNSKETNNNTRCGELELQRRNPSQMFQDKVEKRLENLDCVFSSKCRLRPFGPSVESLFPPLTPEMQDVIEAALIPYPKSEVLIHKFNIKITRRDVTTLNGLNWLNDEVINFYLNLIMERSMKNKGLPRVYVFSTFFYPKLYLKDYKSVSRWTKKVDIFTYDILLVPIHLGVHWCMAIVDFKHQSVEYYDSMLGDNYTCLNVLLEYLKSEHIDKKKRPYKTNDWRVENMKEIPEQMNGSDCGVFSCKFAECKSRLASLDFSQEDMPYFRRRMVYEIAMGDLL